MLVTLADHNVSFAGPGIAGYLREPGNDSISPPGDDDSGAIGDDLATLDRPVTCP